MASERQEKDWWQTCTFFGTFIELRYGDSENIPIGDERIAHDLYCLCGSIDGDGMNCLLGQPQKKLSAMCRSARKLGLVRLAENAEEAAAALRKSGLSRDRKRDRATISALLRPFDKRYFHKLRADAYKRLHKFFYSSEAFVPYGFNCKRMERDGGNPFEPTEWRPPKFKGAE